MARDLRPFIILCTTFVVCLAGCESSSPVEPDGIRSIQPAEGPCNPEVRPC